ncbi:Mlo-like protein [Thalictrum thalictroides]|uniref:MLO-like protein n=1 Tax=Thalictrum thalictroides TaxID=46969 RepID=A0A7J6XAD9_THATH|nr:Mlo-like protein [Thalictrum thalictroides]
MSATYARSLEQTPTWAVAVVCFVIIAISIVIEHIIHFVGKWLKKKHKEALYEALEKVKAELMLVGFISLLLTVGQGPISEMCIPRSVGNTWHPCSKENEPKANYKLQYYSYDSSSSSSTFHSNPRRNLQGYDTKCAAQGKVPLVSTYGIHQLHIFIFVLAITHVLYCILTITLSKAKMRSWKGWEQETRTAAYQFSHDPERFRFARNTTFGRRHMNFWSRSPVLLWIVCFFRQFYGSVLKVDYMTLRHGFIMAHLAPQSAENFDFQKYIKRSLEDDFKIVVGISPIMWFFSILFIMANTHGVFSYLWLPFMPLVIILLVGAKLQVAITQMAVQIQDRGDVIRGVPIVKPTDQLFWFNRPQFIFSLIHFVLFQNAFQIAFFAWTTYEFGLKSCYHEQVEDIAIRMSMGIIIQVLCSYVTLPLYALVTQMGTSMKPTIFNERVAKAIKQWHHTAKKQIKSNTHSVSVTPIPSMPSTPTHGTSPIHLLGNNRYEHDSADTDHWERKVSHSLSLSLNHKHQYGLKEETQEVALTEIEPASPQGQLGSLFRHDNEVGGDATTTRQNQTSIVSIPNMFAFDKSSKD